MKRQLTLIFVSFLLPLSSSDARIPSQYARPSAEWLQSSEGHRIADNILTWQTRNSSWPKNHDTASEPFDGNIDDLHGTFDNGATTNELRFVALAFRATNERHYQQAFLKGLDHIFEAQYPTGGWPQFYPPSNCYHRHITFNDEAMVNILRLLLDVSYSSDYAFLKVGYRTKAKAGIAKGIDCILKTQIKQDGKLTVWCAQHDEKRYEPK